MHHSKHIKEYPYKSVVYCNLIDIDSKNVLTLIGYHFLLNFKGTIAIEEAPLQTFIQEKGTYSH